ncbi:MULTISPECIES: hypothetical protein [Sporosarcina]|uniref:Uncharacterized protein n=2 Tax=Sporosarcina newyorkensis TaxID=759851 RepID=A0A1T4YVT0_9BACL|nr:MULTISPECIES: hypothetical protein [Sporosarcina]EGQ24728.1 hypothetical protein HMPREF9372_2411 [Sporosarcina newyorkensis 2681]MBY0224134.1 hypothetical protein [Sporosarcina aquimarina]SKB05872.1 hypothetical protein SAMN04244570_0016 [Sporosarcina newyorkensis]
MGRQFVNPAELDLRRDLDFLGSLNMVDEGAPSQCPVNECKLIMKQLESIEKTKGYDRSVNPRQCG